MTITEPGFAYIYLSNENGTPVEVFFDDFSVTHTGTDVVQKDDYYPFGGSFNAYTDLSTPQQDYLYNGVRLNKTTQLYETAFRTYDPYLGRFNHVDPLAAMVPGLSPYHFGFNNPVRYNDPLGLMGQDPGMWGTGDTYASHASKNPLGGFTGPGSGNHWSDGYRDPYHNSMLMSTDAFSDFYGLSNDYGGTNYESAGELAKGIVASNGLVISVGVNGPGDGNGNIIPGEEFYVYYVDQSNGGGEGPPNYTSAFIAGAGHSLLLSDEFRAGSNGKYVHTSGKTYSNRFYGNQHVSKYTVQASKLNTASTARFVSKVSNGLVVAGAAVTVYDGIANGWQNLHTADLVVTGGFYVLAASIPVAGWIAGGVYFTADLTTQYYTGKSITENLFD